MRQDIDFGYVVGGMCFAAVPCLHGSYILLLPHCVVYVSENKEKHNQLDEIRSIIV